MKWDRWRLLRFAFLEVLPRVALVWILLACGMKWLNTKLVYHPMAEIELTPAECGIPYDDVTIVTADGVKLNAWYSPAPEPASGTVLFCHGNGGNISHRIETINLLRRLGMNVLVFDYRGYGRSEGSPGEQGTYLDAEASWKYLVETRGVRPERIVIHGRSLGGSVAAHLAMGHRPAGLIVESSFYDITELGAELYWFLPVRWLSRMKYSTAEYVKAVRCPVLVIHSADDGLIPFHHAEKNFAAAHEPKRLVEIHGGHNGGFVESSAIYDPALRQFFGQTVGAENSSQ